jgi:hypothetical protein
MPHLTLLLLAIAGCAARQAPVAVAVPAAEVAIEGIERTVFHTHGESGASVDRVALELRNPGEHVRLLRVAGVERLHGSCNQPGWTDTRALAVREPLGEVKLLPGEAMNLAVLFDPVECYNACDTFGFRVHLRVDGVARVVEVPLVVEREEPGDFGE